MIKKPMTNTTIDNLRTSLLGTLTSAIPTEEELRESVRTNNKDAADAYEASLRKGANECVNAIQHGLDEYIKLLNRGVHGYLDAIDGHYKKVLSDAIDKIRRTQLDDADIVAANEKSQRLQIAMAALKELEDAISRERTACAESIIKVVAADQDLRTSLNEYRYSWSENVNKLVKQAAIDDIQATKCELAHAREMLTTLRHDFLSFVGAQDSMAQSNHDETRRSLDELASQVQKAGDHSAIAVILKEAFGELDEHFAQVNSNHRLQGNRIVAKLRQRIDRLRDQIERFRNDTDSDSGMLVDEIDAIHSALERMAKVPPYDLFSLFSKAAYTRAMAAYPAVGDWSPRRQSLVLAVILLVAFVLMSAGSGIVGNYAYERLRNPATTTVGQPTQTLLAEPVGLTGPQVGTPIIFRYPKRESRILVAENADQIRDIRNALSKLHEGSYVLRAKAHASKEPIRNRSDYSSNEELAIARSNAARLFFGGLINEMRLSEKGVRVAIATDWDLDLPPGSPQDKRICVVTLYKL